MQDTHFLPSTQTPSISLFAEGIRVRLEQFILNAQNLLEHYQQDGYEKITDDLELTHMELRYLLNEMYLLKSLVAS